MSLPVPGSPNPWVCRAARLVLSPELGFVPSPSPLTAPGLGRSREPGEGSSASCQDQTLKQSSYQALNQELKLNQALNQEFNQALNQEINQVLNQELKLNQEINQVLN